MTKVIIQVALVIVIVVIGYYLYDSITEPMEFQRQKREREIVVVEKLKDIRTSQHVYRQIKGSYSNNFDSLTALLKIAEIPIVKMIPDPTDTTFTKTINDTVGFIVVADSLFRTKSYSIDELSLIPYSDGDLFTLDADTIVRGGVKVHVFEVLAPYSSFLKGLDVQAVINVTAKQEDIERYPGLKVGSLTEPSTNGNWE